MGTTARRRALRWGVVFGAVAISCLFGYLAVRDVKWSSTWAALQESNYWWLLPALVALAAATFMRAVRWRSLFRRESRPAIGPVTRATLVGLFFNNLLPARAGEAARIVSLKTWGGTSMAESTATVVVERVLDVLCLLALLFVLSPWFPHVSWLHAAAIVALVAVVLAIALVGLALYLSRDQSRFVRVASHVPLLSHATVERLTASVSDGLEAARRPRQALVATSWTIASWLVLGLSFWFLTIGFDLDLPLLAGVLVAVAVGLSFIIPAAPGGLGVFEAAGLAATHAYGIPRSEALAYVLVLHALNFLPYIAAGLVLLAAETPRRRRRVRGAAVTPQAEALSPSDHSSSSSATRRTPSRSSPTSRW